MKIKDIEYTERKSASISRPLKNMKEECRNGKNEDRDKPEGSEKILDTI